MARTEASSGRGRLTGWALAAALNFGCTSPVELPAPPVPPGDFQSRLLVRTEQTEDGERVRALTLDATGPFPPLNGPLNAPFDLELLHFDLPLDVLGLPPAGSEFDPTTRTSTACRQPCHPLASFRQRLRIGRPPFSTAWEEVRPDLDGPATCAPLDRCPVLAAEATLELPAVAPTEIADLFSVDGRVGALTFPARLFELAMPIRDLGPPPAALGLARVWAAPDRAYAVDDFGRVARIEGFVDGLAWGAIDERPLGLGAPRIAALTGQGSGPGVRLWAAFRDPARPDDPIRSFLIAPELDDAWTPVLGPPLPEAGTSSIALAFLPSGGGVMTFDAPAYAVLVPGVPPRLEIFEPAPIPCGEPERVEQPSLRAVTWAPSWTDGPSLIVAGSNERRFQCSGPELYVLELATRTLTAVANLGDTSVRVNDLVDLGDGTVAFGTEEDGRLGRISAEAACPLAMDFRGRSTFGPAVVEDQVWFALEGSTRVVVSGADSVPRYCSP